MIKVVFSGHIDHGKSTLIGRLLVETGNISEGKLEQVKNACEQKGKEFEYAFLLDGLKEEQEQGITIETTQLYFSVNNKDFLIIDAPGHIEFTRNMITGASQADVAVLLIDITEGIKEQTYRHSLLLRLLGIKKLIVVINKMDMISYEKALYLKTEDSVRRMLAKIGIKNFEVLPVSAKNGDNITKPSSNMRWYKGKSFLETLMSLSISSKEPLPLRFPIQDVYKFDTRRIIAGTILSGKISVSDTIKIYPEGKTTKVKTIEGWPQGKQQASKDDSIGITVEDDLFFERGQMITHPESSPLISNIFNATLFWISSKELSLDKKLILKLNTQQTYARIISIENIIDTSSLQHKKSSSSIRKNEIAEVTIFTDTPVVFDTYHDNSYTGRFVLIDEYTISGGGIITSGEETSGRTYQANIMQRHVSPVKKFITIKDREIRQKHKGCIIWITGLPGAGKTELARQIEKYLFEKGYNVYFMDAEDIRLSIDRDLGFSDEDRSKHVRNVAEIANMFKNAGLITIVSIVSPFEKDREYAKKLAGSERFILVYLNTPLEECIKNDPHGIYSLAKQGKLKNVTGIDSPYEAPANPDIVVTPNQIDKVLEYILQKIKI